MSRNNELGIKIYDRDRRGGRFYGAEEELIDDYDDNDKRELVYKYRMSSSEYERLKAASERYKVPMSSIVGYSLEEFFKRDE